MATWATQLTRIATEMTRNDLTSSGALYSTLQAHYQDAVEEYARRKFWFNSILATASTAASTATVAVPATVRIVERVTIPAYYRELRAVQQFDLPDDTTVESLPEYYAFYGATDNDYLRLWPVPDAVYTLNVYGVAYIAAPTATSDDTIWTNAAAPLIRARTKKTLFRDVFRDPEGAALAANEEGEALASLLAESRRRDRSRLVIAAGPSRYNINIDT